MLLRKFVDEATGILTCVKLEENNNYVIYWTNNGSRRHDIPPEVKKTSKEIWDEMVKQVNG